MKIKLSSVFVEDQEKALLFYANILGFVKKNDMPAGQFRWLTVVSPDGPEDMELLLEPNDNPAAKEYQGALFEQGIPMNAFAVDDVEEEYKRLRALGVVFRSEPVKMGPTTIAMFEDTCGNIIQIYQV
jgi:catechol 2,3-dioxygenase-like lactoylglutathione lyase family enzyme